MFPIGDREMPRLHFNQFLVGQSGLFRQSLELREKTQEADNEVGGIAATNYSSCGQCFGVFLARIAWEDIRFD
jgi:hypothetical protein